VLVDYHVHLDKFDWNLESIEGMCNKAKEVGVDKIGVVVHTRAIEEFEPLYRHILSDGMEHRKLKFDRSLDSYINLLESAKKKGYPVSTGVEVCYSKEGEDFLSQKLSQ